VTAYKICVFNRWTAGLGQFTESVRLIAPDQTTAIRKGQVKFTLQDAAHHATNITVLPQIEFATAGIYYLEVLVYEVMKRRLALPVVAVTPPQTAASAPAAPPPQQPA